MVREIPIHLGNDPKFEKDCPRKITEKHVKRERRFQEISALVMDIIKDSKELDKASIEIAIKDYLNTL